MKGEGAIYSSQREDWRTPSGLFEALDAEFGFHLDAAASDSNARCPRYLTEEQDALTCVWPGNGPVWLNPPYGNDLGRWMEKAYLESTLRVPYRTVVCLIPARTDTFAWHEYVMKADEIRFIRGRLRFDNTDTAAPFPSAVVIFRGYRLTPPRIRSMDRYRTKHIEGRR